VPRLTAVESRLSRLFYFCNAAAGVPEYCSGVIVRGVSDVAGAEDLAAVPRGDARVQQEAQRGQ
jgi:hypothetical protein